MADTAKIELVRLVRELPRTQAPGHWTATFTARWEDCEVDIPVRLPGNTAEADAIAAARARLHAILQALEVVGRPATAG